MIERGRGADHQGRGTGRIFANKKGYTNRRRSSFSSSNYLFVPTDDVLEWVSGAKWRDVQPPPTAPPPFGDPLLITNWIEYLAVYTERYFTLLRCCNVMTSNDDVKNELERGYK